MPKPQRAPSRLNQEPEAVQWARKRSGLTQTALAKRAGLARTLVVEIEGGTRSATDENLIKLAEALNCPVVMLERKREPETSTSADGALSELRNRERPDGADDVPELRGPAVERSA